MPLDVHVHFADGGGTVSLAQSCFIELNNNEVVPVVFKVFTRHPAKFRITPHEGFLLAKEKVVVAISHRLSNGGDAVSHSEANPVGHIKTEEFRIELRGALGQTMPTDFASAWKSGVPDASRILSATIDTRPLPPHESCELTKTKIAMLTIELEAAEGRLSASNTELGSALSTAARLEPKLHNLQFGVVVPVWLASVLAITAFLLPLTAP
jgi:hypothetical protein